MATPTTAISQLATKFENEGLTERSAADIGKQIAATFGVKADEVAILQVQKQSLVFMYPMKLHNVGSIPLNTAGSVAARSANVKRAEVLNSFAQTRHATVFEAVELGEKQERVIGTKAEKQIRIIQKLMTAPVVTPAGVVGVIQVCRKGSSGPEAGPDFTPADLQQLVGIAGALAKCFK